MKILVIEDEPQTAEILIEIIREVNPGAMIIGTTESIDQSVIFLAQNRPDLILMDIQLADGLSFEIFSRAEVQCPVIFCTAYDQYTLQAFKANGIEYILKPVRKEDISAAFDKVEKLKKALNPDQTILHSIQHLLTDRKSYKTSLLVQHRQSYIPLEVQRVGIFMIQNELVQAYCFDNQKYIIQKTMDEIEHFLDPSSFFRINRQTLLHRNAVLELQPYFNRKMAVKTRIVVDKPLIVSRLKVSAFMQWLEQA